MKSKLFVLFCCATFLLSGCGGSASTAADAMESEVGDGNTTSIYSMGTVAATETEAVVTSAPQSTEAVAEGIRQEPAEEMIHYVSFHMDTKIYQNEEGQDLLRETFTDPVFYSPNTQLSDWVNEVMDGVIASEKKLGSDLLDYAQEELDRIGADFYTFSHYLTMGVGRHDSNVISLLTLSSMYSGGPHPSTIQTALNLDMRAYRVLVLEDVIREEAAGELLDRVSTGVLDKFASMGGEGLYPDYETTIRNSLTYGNMTSHWYFNEKGLVIFFNQYVLAPFAAGIIKVELAYDSLAEILRPEFLPRGYSGTVTDVQVSKTTPQTDQVLSVSFGQGDTVYLHPVGKASHVQLSQVFFAEEVPVGESMLFSANYLDDSVTIALQGDWQNDTVIYGVEYSDESVDSNVIYSTSAQVWEEIP